MFLDALAHAGLLGIIEFKDLERPASLAPLPNSHCRLLWTVTMKGEGMGRDFLFVCFLFIPGLGWQEEELGS